MRRTAGALALACLLLAGCPAKKEAAVRTKSTGRAVAVVSIPPLAYLLDQLRWDRLQVAVLLPEGSSPMEQNPRATLPDGADRAKLYFGLGLPFEAPLVAKLRAAAPDLEVVDVHDGIDLLEGANGATLDSHVWLDPKLARAMARTMAEALSDLDGGKDREVEANLAELLSGLDTLHLELEGILAPIKGSTLYVVHPVYSYFCLRYGCKQVSLARAGAAPVKGAALERFVKRAASAGARGVYVQPFWINRALTAAAASVRLRVITLDPLARDYASGMRDLATTLKESAAAPRAR